MVESGKTAFFPNMFGLIGSYTVTLDAKNRFLLPAGIRKTMREEDTAVIAIKGIDNHLYLYTAEQWAPIYERLMTLDDFDDEERLTKRYFFDDAAVLELDSAGRLLLTKELKEYAGIEKEMKISFVGGKFEVWNPELKEKKKMEKSSEEQREIVKRVMAAKKNLNKNAGE